MKRARSVSVERDKPNPKVKLTYTSRDEVHSESFVGGSPADEESDMTVSSPKSSSPTEEMGIKSEDEREAQGGHEIGGAEDEGLGGGEERVLAIRGVAIKEEYDSLATTNQCAQQAIKGQAIQEGFVAEKCPVANPTTASQPENSTQTTLTVPRKVYPGSARMRSKKTNPPINQTKEWLAENTIQLDPLPEWNRGGSTPRDWSSRHQGLH